MLQVIYAEANGCACWKELRDIAIRFENDYGSVNYLMTRQFEFNSDGRFGDSKYAIAMDRHIEKMLKEWGVDAIQNKIL